MKASTQTATPAMLQAATSASEPFSVEPTRRRLRRVRELNATNLTALVSEVHQSHYIENALWITLGFASLALLALSFLM